MTQIWPEWATPSNESQIQLAKILLPHIKVLSPEIVKVIVEENNNKLAEWTNEFNNIGIRADIYLWKNSPITFPGIRRHVGKDEEMTVKKSRTNARANDALLLDDNSFPKELWSYVLRGRKADKNGPSNYSLAHILDHKDYKSKNEYELKGFKTSGENLYAGLYSSCANTIWVPNNLLKPTDHKGNLRKLLIQIIDKYYNSVCTILPHDSSLDLENIEDEWKLDNFPKPEIVGNIDKAKDFIAYRNKIIDDRIKELKLTPHSASTTPKKEKVLNSKTLRELRDLEL
ncbi:MAG TPA: hypothetical protein VF411_04690 [Bacteroidia bacterium]